VGIQSPVHVGVRVQAVGERGYYYTFARDLSAIGMFVMTEQPAELGTELEFTFDLSEGQRNVLVRGTVRRVVQPELEAIEAGLSVEFSSVSPNATSALRDFVAGRVG